MLPLLLLFNDVAFLCLSSGALPVRQLRRVAEGTGETASAGAAPRRQQPPPDNPGHAALRETN